MADECRPASFLEYKVTVIDRAPSLLRIKPVFLHPRQDLERPDACHQRVLRRGANYVDPDGLEGVIGALPEVGPATPIS